MPDLYDPKGVIRDAFAIKGITAAECRSIFLDWALGVGLNQDMTSEVRKLIAYYGPDAAAEHPMMATLQAALQDTGPPRRRGGRKARL